MEKPAIPEQKQKLLLEAVFQSARTTLDGGWRISFDLGEAASEQMTQLLAWKDTSLYLAIVPTEGEL